MAQREWEWKPEAVRYFLGPHFKLSQPGRGAQSQVVHTEELWQIVDVIHFSEDHHDLHDNWELGDQRRGSSTG